MVSGQTSRRRDALGQNLRVRTCVGAGLLTLDLVFNQESPGKYQVRSGGSCGNVLTILAYLGWESRPVARIGRDEGGDIVLKDLASFGVDTAFVVQEDSTSTPAILQAIKKPPNGSRTHSYSLHCPQCRSFLLRYRAISGAMAGTVVEQIPDAAVFYFDRVSRGTLNLANHYREHGSFIVFEPSSVTDEKLFSEATAVAHLLKYSVERLPDIAYLVGGTDIPLEIQTLGPEGLRYRWRQSDSNGRLWSFMLAYPVSDMVDEAGAGDWCTAGLISALGQEGARSFWNAEPQELEQALKLGQAMAAVNCNFPSARGVMYSLLPSEMNSAAMGLMEGKLNIYGTELGSNITLHNLVNMVCSHCSLEDDL